MTIDKATLALLAALLTPAMVSGSEDPQLLEARDIAARFTAQLKSELTTAISDGGPELAISVCKDSAPRIAVELSRASGATVSRTSLRLRNSANAPEPWQEEILRRFDSARASGDQGSLEYFATAGNSRRYMKAIPTGGVCLACHGMELSPAVEAALAEHYPADRARGYQAGDIRGAISIVWQDQETTP